MVFKASWNRDKYSLFQLRKMAKIICCLLLVLSRV